MCAVFTCLGSVMLVMLAGLLAPTSGDTVTTLLCSDYSWRGRVRHYPVDHNATHLNCYRCHQLVNGINESDILGLPNVTKIDLSDGHELSKIDLAVFHHVPKLDYLTLSYNKLRELPVFPKNSCPNLTTLYVSSNELKEFIDPNTFSACTKLRNLDLGSNQITYIHPDLFSPLAELDTLDLRSNKLTFIPEQSFTRNLKLRYLWITDNKLTYLPKDFASNIKSAGGGLETFYFADNPLQCPCLLELLADLKRAGEVAFQFTDQNIYSGKYPRCKFVRAPCGRPPPGLLPPPRGTTAAVDSKLEH